MTTGMKMVNGDRRNKKIRIAAVGDLHCTVTSKGHFQDMFARINAQADVLLLCGDLTDYGLPEEADVLAHELAAVHLPTLAVLGNHDFHSGQAETVQKKLIDAGLQVLDGESCEVEGIGFAGTKGFAGGFDTHSLQPWGEEAIKTFVNNSVDEAVKLESALAKLHTNRRIAILHYSPIAATIQGEPPELSPFLGSSRLEDPLNRYSVTAAFHGHSHYGSPSGRTTKNVPVYNVAMPLLTRLYPDRSPFFVFEISKESAEAAAARP